MSTEPRILWAAGRDASWYSHPNATSPKKVHVVAEDACGSLCGLPVLDPDHRRLLEDVPEVNRCRRDGCRQIWPAAGPSSS